MVQGTAVGNGDIVSAAALNSAQFSYLPNPDTRGTAEHTLQFRVLDTGSTDNGGSYQSAEIYAIDITVISDHPPQAEPDTVAVIEGGVVSSLSSGSVRVTDNDIDFDTPTDQLLVELTGAPLHGELQLNRDGTFTYSHDGGETRSDSFSYRVIDSETELNSLLGSIGLVEIEITPDNDAPVAGDLEDVLAAVNQPVQIVLPDNLFTDADIGDTLTYTAAMPSGDPLPEWLNIDSQTGELSGVPVIASVGTLEIVVTATDTAGASAQSQLQLVVEPQFDAALPETDNSIPDYITCLLYTSPSPRDS